MMNNQEVYDVFGDGIQYVTDEGWVDPDEIEDPNLRDSYWEVISAYEVYNQAASKFQKLLDEL